MFINDRIKIWIVTFIALFVVFVLFLSFILSVKAFELPKFNEIKEEILRMPDEIALSDSSHLLPNKFTPAGYVPPKYDPFDNKFRHYHGFEELIPKSKRAVNGVPNAKIHFSTVKNVFADKFSATVGSEVIFDAGGSTDKESNSDKLFVRWDFDGDGKFDTYFSRTKKEKHFYKNSGFYDVVLEVMDDDGGIGVASLRVHIVNNHSPVAKFSVDKIQGTLNKVFYFNTGASFDSQYRKNSLKYRFDFDGDGKFDTGYESKTRWSHVFRDVGMKHVVMECVDPEGLFDTTYVDINVINNVPPVAVFVVKERNGNLLFDASGSYDVEDGKKVKIRWDFDYTGVDDISFDTYFGYSKIYRFSNRKVHGKSIRLQVLDSDGAVSEFIYSF